MLTLSGSGPAGSAQLTQSFATQTSGDYFPQVYCTGEEGFEGIARFLATSFMVTGTATAVVHNANGTDGADLGPVSAVGGPFDCAALAGGSAAGVGFVQTFSFVHLDTIGDVAISEQLFAYGTPPAATPTPMDVCAGDCDASRSVSIEELIRIVNIALGIAQPAACPHGIPSGRAVDITLIVQAVGEAFMQCQ